MDVDLDKELPSCISVPERNRPFPAVYVVFVSVIVLEIAVPDI